MHPHKSSPQEDDLLARLQNDNPYRKITALPEDAWGHYITPGPDENPGKTNEGLRILIFGSWTMGILAFEAIRELENRYPDRVNIVGLITDDPLNPDAKISKQKRFWRYYGPSKQERYVLDLTEEALEYGVPCYTSKVKNEIFRSYLTEWAPDAIIVSAFGQRIDTPIIQFPTYGIYNVHPADLLHGHGAGAQPWEDLISRKAQTTRLTIHKVSEEIDSGSVVGYSPPLNVTLAHGKYSDDVCLIGEKTLLPVKRMVSELVLQLWSLKQSGRQKPLDAMDFEACFSTRERETLMQSIHPEQRGHILPLSPEHLDDTV